MEKQTLLLIDFSSEAATSRDLVSLVEPGFSLATFPLNPESFQGSGALADTHDDVGRRIQERIQERLGADRPAVILVAGDSCRQPGLCSMIAWLCQRWPQAPTVLAAHADCSQRLMALFDRGVADFISLPASAAELSSRLWRLTGTAAERPDSSTNDSDTTSESASPSIRRLKQKLGLRQLVGESPAFLRVVERLGLMAKCDATVLIDGETGTGKEVCARTVHYLSDRSDRPFVPVNCGAIPEELIENELFGHRRAAYTSASTDQEGLIASAEGGTLLLDEIDSLPMSAQVKLLRFLQDKEYRPLGSTQSRTADVRLIAATNADLEARVEAGTFRQDLYYRLHVLPVTLPPLRERRDDIVRLARHFLAKHANEHSIPCPPLSPNAVAPLLAYHWPGNVRELENVMERAVLLCSGQGQVTANKILLPSQRQAQDSLPQTFRQAKQRVVARFERSYVEDLLVAHHGNISSAARAAAKNRRAFFELIRKHDIDVDRIRAMA